MGYTHYWERPTNRLGSLYQFTKLATDTQIIVNEAKRQGIAIGDNFGNGDNANITTDAIAFNGAGDEAYETFYWEHQPEQVAWRADEPNYFNFCKTAHRPYDAVVTAVLIRAKEIYGSLLTVSSDGTWGDWQMGRNLYEQVFNKPAPCPFEVVGV